MRTDLFVLAKFECTPFVCTCFWDTCTFRGWSIYTFICCSYFYHWRCYKRKSAMVGACVVLELELLIVSRIILLDSVLGVILVWVDPLSH